MLFLVIVIAVIVLVILIKKGVFRKPDACQSCGKELKGTEQQVFKAFAPFCLCKECANKIHPQIFDYAKKNWSYTDYTDYLAWDAVTKEERAKFVPDEVYGYELAVDTERGLFSIGTGKKGGLVFRFADLSDYDLNFKPEEVKEGILGDKVKGNEFVAVELACPKVYIEEVIKYGVSLRLRKTGFFSSKYEYEFSDGFSKVIRAFSVCVAVEIARRNGEYQNEKVNINEVEEALALFMFDSMDEVTLESLENMRNTMVNSVHSGQNTSYLQKIDDAYDLLKGMALRKASY